MPITVWGKPFLGRLQFFLFSAEMLSVLSIPRVKNPAYSCDPTHEFRKGLVMDLLNGNTAPSSDQCHNLLKRYAVPDHIIRHSEAVSRVAVFLAESLDRSAEQLCIEVVEAAALLHDITKMEGITSRQDHAETGRRLLEGLGFRRIGEIVGQHIKLQANRETSWIREAEIINYADKRVVHTETSAHQLPGNHPLFSWFYEIADLLWDHACVREAPRPRGALPPHGVQGTAFCGGIPAMGL